MSTITKRFKCLECGARFSTETSVRKHIAERHIADDGELVRFVFRSATGEQLAVVASNANGEFESDPDERRAQKWYIFCNQHHACVGVSSVRDAIHCAKHTSVFCEVCAGTAPYCVACELSPATWAIDEHLAHGTVLNASAS